MNDYRSFQTQGNTALAARRWETGERGSLIDYDIARRSFEARQRLAQRQQREGAPQTAKGKRLSRRNPYVAQDSLQRLVLESYRPQRGIARTLGDALRALAALIARHPFSAQLKGGSAAGRATGRLSYRQFLSSGALCLVLGAAIIFVGA